MSRTDALNFAVKTFDQLTSLELYKIMRLRQEVFVVEQDCAYLDADGKDTSAIHLLGFVDNEIVAYARIMAKGISYEQYASIGRVIVLKKHRRKGLGTVILEKAIEVARTSFKDQSIKISAQCYALSLYQSVGFQAVGEEYLEDGIPHMGMVFTGE